MRILWHGVPSEFGTGYGTQTNLFTPALRDAGHEVAISSIVPDMWRKDKNGIQIYPSGFRGNYGNDLVIGHAADFKADVVLSCMDTHVVDVKKFAQFWWVAWQVIDSSPMAPELAEAAPMARTRLAMSEFGQRVLQDAGFTSDYVPLAIDCDLFRPCASESKVEARLELAKHLHADPFDDRTFLVVMNSANMSFPSRKNFYAALAGFEEARKVLAADGTRAVLYIHTEPTGTIFNGENLCTMAEQLGIPVKSLYFPPQYPFLVGRIPQQFVRGVYCSADVFLHTARGEGFGLPIVEAMSCGCPVIAPYNTSLIEFNCDLYLTRQTPFASSSGTVQYVVDPNDVTSQLLTAHAERSRLFSEEQRIRRRLVAERYDIHAVLPMLEKALQSSFAKYDPTMVVKEVSIKALPGEGRYGQVGQEVCTR